MRLTKRCPVGVVVDAARYAAFVEPCAVRRPIVLGADQADRS